VSAPDSSTPPQDAARYPRALRVLHWVLALAICLQVVLILVFRQLQSVEFANIVLSLHRSGGTVIWFLIVLRLVMGVRVRAPAPQSGWPPWQTVAAQAVHCGLIAIVLAQPILGVMSAWSRGDEVLVLGLARLPALVTFTDAQAVTLKLLHRWTAYGLFALVAVHLGAVAFNRWVRKVSVMERMLSPPAADRLTNRVPLSVQLTLTCGLILALSAGAGLYGANQYRTFSDARDRFDESAVSTLDDRRAPQLDL
jgi:cytochrome b561